MFTASVSAQTNRVESVRSKLRAPGSLSDASLFLPILALHGRSSLVVSDLTVHDSCVFQYTLPCLI